MEFAEQKAKTLNTNHILLTTFNYQGENFYQKLGYTEIGRIPNYPEPGVDKIYFLKKIT